MRAIRVAALGGLGLAASLGLASAATPDLGTPAQRDAGKLLYEKYCSQCHGEKGDGAGVAAAHLKPKPRDFTKGKFKIRSTPGGSVPTTADLVRIIRHGMPYSTMPAWPSFKDDELQSLAYYVKSFSPHFSDAESNADPVPLPQPPPFSKERAEQGKKLYADTGCARCHGVAGRGDGPSAPTLKDDWGNHLHPAVLERPWTFRGGATRADIFRAITTGLTGTPMPAFQEALSEEQRWQLVDFIASLSGREQPNYSNLVRVARVNGELDITQADETFASAEPAFFPVVGQISQPGREFHPSCNGIEVTAVQNGTDIAIRLRWTDMRAETSGKNDPAQKVPDWKDDPFGGAPKAAAPATDSGDVWGDEVATPAAGGTAASGAGGDFWGEGESEPAAASQTPETEFSDAVAIQFPLDEATEVRRPYFIFGDAGHAVDLWFLDLAHANPVQYVGKGYESLESQGAGDLSAIKQYEQGRWTAIFKRPLRSRGGAHLEEGKFTPVAFSVWDGFNRERGNKRGLTTWYHLYVEAGTPESPVAPMARAAGSVLAVELVVIAVARRRRKAS
ncbi:MAG: c-type cytochrome [bacterium]